MFGVGKTPKTAYRAAWKRTPDMFCVPRDCVEIETTDDGYESLASEVEDRQGWASLYPEQWIGTPFRIDENRQEA